ncbi:MAG: right-handed parallel beta-helix repeat-containing protein [Promethearchaeota archaeon]
MIFQIVSVSLYLLYAIRAYPKSSITIIGSDVHFTLRNSSFFNGREGVLLEYVSNGELTCLNCSQNGGNGIDLEYCQNINIASCSVNNNTLNGIKLLNCNKISITYNVDTINYNKENGIHLEGSDNNTIIGNTIHHNTVNGIFLDEFSDNNFIDWNTFQGNGEPYYIAEGALNNVIGGNNKFLSGRVGRGEFPFDMIIILLIITVAVFGSIATAVIVKKRMSRVEKKEKEISEQKREKIRRKLEDKLKFVDHLIKERQIKLAYKNLGKIKDTADQYDFFAIFNTANRKVELVKDIEAGIYRAEPSEVQREVPRTPIASREESVMPGTTEEVREQIETTPLITRKKEKNINVFLSYSTLDVDRFQIERVANALGNTPEIKRVYYYVKDSGQNIVDYMEKTLRVCNTFVLFCTKHSKESKAVEGEWQAAYQLVKRDMMKIIPVYEDEEDVPILLITMLNVKYDRDDFNGFVNKLRQEILR